MGSLAFGSFFDGVLTRQERACLASFVRHGHSVTLFSYQPTNLPSGVIARDAAEILPAARLYRDRTGGLHHGTVSQFSDHFRYEMIRKTGLVWVDTDVICLKADWPDREWLWAAQDPCLVNGAILRVPSRHALLDRAIEVMEKLGDTAVWALAGPYLLTPLMWEFQVSDTLLPQHAFYSLHYSRALDLLRPMTATQTFSIHSDALCIHLWNEVLRMGGHDKQAGPHPGSPLAALLDLAEGKRPEAGN